MKLRIRATSERATALVLAAFALTVHLVAYAQTDVFTLRFEYRPCGPIITEQLDTAAGAFTANLGGDPPRTVSVRMSLSRDQMITIRKAVHDIGFFGYVSPFFGVPTGVYEVTTISPAPSYRLEVREAGTAHAVSWLDQSRPSSIQADRLRDLMLKIRAFIHDQPEFKRLPAPAVACE